jgi:hypothetical protein
MAWREKDFEESMTPHIDTIYKKLFTKLSGIKRSNRDIEHDEKIIFMDRELAIDTFLYFTDGTMLTLQEKTRKKYFFDKYGADFTFEYFNNPYTKAEGEWFKLAAQLYFYGYARDDLSGYERFWIVNIHKLRLFLKNHIGLAALENKYLRQNSSHGTANFFAIPFSIIHPQCIMYDSGK